jgi:hypothetical protein
VARRCHWRFEWVSELDPDVYELLIEQLQAEDEAAS